jgi:uncharacterized protein
MKPSVPLCYCNALLCGCTVLCFVLALGTPGAAASQLKIPRTQAEVKRLSVKQEIQLGAAYMAGRGVPQDFVKAAYWYERAANAGDPLAQNQIGYFYQSGMGVRQDPARAALWYQRSADSGFLKAKVNLGVAYLWGVGVKKDAQLGYELIHQAAVQNCGVADAYLGEIHSFGMGVPVDREAARGWYERGAHANDSLAEFRLAVLLSTENPSRQDLLKASKLFRQSIKGGYVAARHSLGLLLINHPELPGQPDEAVGHLQKASQAGIWQSSAVLGSIYRDGTRIPRDERKAFYYFKLAQVQGGGTALRTVAKDVSILSRELTPDQAATLSAKAEEWPNSHPLALQFVYKDSGSSNEFPVSAISVANEGTHSGRLGAPSPAKAEP